jgi:class 3 adenylate cyclase
VSIAYQVAGEGPLDLVIVPGFISHLEFELANPFYTEYLRGLTSFARVIRFDKRGTGLSDPVPGVPTLEERMEDLHAVMDAAGVERAAVYGISEGGPMAILFAATYPERVSALILYGTYASGSAPGAEGGMSESNYPRVREMIDEWGEGRSAELFAPSLVDDDNLRRMVGTFERSAASPGMVRALMTAALEIDVREILPLVQVPTLVVHRKDELVVPPEAAMYMAEHIPGARYVELEGNDHAPWIGDRQSLVNAIEEFLTGARHVHEPDRVLATVLFTDIVGSTERAAELGDSQWRELLERHDALARSQVEAHRGRVVKSLGDGMLAAFNGPCRAIRCAESLCEEVGGLGMQLRAGVHTGECEAMGDDIGGLAVHIGSRVAAKAGPGEVMVSSTVRDLVVGSGLAFEDAGEHELKGVPGEWRLFRVGAARQTAPPIQATADVMTPGDRAFGRIARLAPGALRALNRRALKERSAA